MQITGEASEAVTSFSWVGAELLTVFQVLFFLVLGYVSLRVWFSLRLGTKRAPTKKVDDVSEEAEEGVEPSLPSQSKVRSRHSNAADRKRQRKESKRVDSKPPVAALQPECSSTEVVPEPDAPAEEPVEVVQDVMIANDRVSKLVMKKAERKARMNAKKMQMESDQHPEEQASPLAKSQKPDSETSSQDGQTSRTASTPSTMSTAASNATLATTEQSDCGTPDSPRSKTDADDTLTPQFEIALAPRSKKGKKKQQKTAVNAVQDNLHPTKNSEAIPSVVAIEVPCDETPQTTAEAAKADVVPKCVNASEKVELKATEDALDSVEQPQLVDEVHTEQDESVEQGDEEVSISKAPLNLDDLESDTDSDADIPECPLEQSPHAADMATTPVMWCGMPEDPNMQIEGWVAVAVPAECAPPGAFDGLWMNKGEEKILIEKLDIMFESGEAWKMEMHSMANISVQVGGEQFCGELDTSGDVTVLNWSDGDVWTFYGKVGDSTEVPPQETPEIPCMMDMSQMDMSQMAPFMPESMPVVDMTPCTPCNQYIPPDAKDWEICYDWKKKGCCRRPNCEWYHPVADASYF